MRFEISGRSENVGQQECYGTLVLAQPVVDVDIELRLNQPVDIALLAVHLIHLSKTRPKFGGLYQTLLIVTGEDWIIPGAV